MTEAPSDATEPTSPAPAATPRRRTGLAIGIGLVAVLLAATSALATVFGLRLHHKNQVADAEAQALQAARMDAVYLTSYDYRTLTDDFGNVESNSTANFRQKFEQTGSLLRPALAKDQASAKGIVRAAAVSSGSSSRVVVLAFVDQSVVTPSSTTAQNVTTRLQMTMVRSGGRWLMDDVRIV
jgi:Mce-associated membrane protein